jgi:hypothetical protein
MQFDYDQDIYDLASRISKLCIVESRYLNNQILTDDIYYFIKQELDRIDFDILIQRPLYDPFISEFTFDVAKSIWELYLKPIKRAAVKKHIMTVKEVDKTDLYIYTDLNTIYKNYQKYLLEYKKKRL